MNKKLKNKYIEEMKKAKVSGENYEIAEAHRKADHVLCDLLNELGYEELIDLYFSVEKWYA